MLKNYFVIGIYKSFCFILSFLLFFIASQSSMAQDDNGVTSGAAKEASPLALPTPLASERGIAPIPERFSWLTRGSQSNSLLESLLDFREGPTNLLMSVSLTGEYSSNFSRGSNVTNTGDTQGEGEEYRALLSLGTVYRLEKGHGFLSFANSFSTNYRFKAEESDIAFANLNFTAGYDFPRLSIALHESFMRDDDLNSDSLRNDPSVGLTRQRGTFSRNSIGPQVRYTLSRTTSASVGYTYVVTLREGSTSDLTSSHSASIGVDQQLSRNLRMNATYSFTTTDGSLNTTGVANGSSNNTANRVHSPALQLSYAVDKRTSLSLQGTSRFSRRDSPGMDSRTYGATLGINRVLTPYLSANVAVGPEVFETEGADRRIFPNWEVQLNGDLPFFRTRLTRLTLAAHQSIDDTSTEVNDVGLALRQTIALTLHHAISSRLRTSFFVDYGRTEILQNVGTAESSDGRIDNLWNAGTQVSYLFTRSFSLLASYRHQQRTSNINNADFANNIVMIVFSSSFPVF